MLRVAHPSSVRQRAASKAHTRGSCAVPLGAHWEHVRPTRSPAKGNRSPAAGTHGHGATCARVRQASGFLFLTIHLSCYRAPAGLSVRTHVVIIYRFAKPRPWAFAQGIASFLPALSGGGGGPPTWVPSSSPLSTKYIHMVSFRLSVVRQAGLVLLQAALWPLAAGLRRIRGCSIRRAPALRGGRTEGGSLPGSQLLGPGRDHFREILTEALPPGAWLPTPVRPLQTSAEAGSTWQRSPTSCPAGCDTAVMRFRMTSAVSFRPGWSRLALTHRTSPASHGVSSRSRPGRGIVPCRSCSCSPTLWRLYRTACGLVDHCTTASRSWPSFPTCWPDGTCLITSKPGGTVLPGCSAWL